MQTQTKRFSRVAFPFLAIALNTTSGGWKDTSVLGIARRSSAQNAQKEEGDEEFKEWTEKEKYVCIKIKKETTKQEAAFEE